jgi:succinylarginine dihydrolase
MTRQEVASEYNFDGLVGPTHNYAGLSRGNLASREHAGWTSKPRAAALQGLRKMARLRELGLGQGVLLPHERPHLPTLRHLGFVGSDAEVLASAQRQAPGLLLACSSASAMWTANAATLAPSADTKDGKLHLTVANLASMFHRQLEAPTTARILKSIFNHGEHFVVHDALPASVLLGDEGAANHLRLHSSVGTVHLMAWGRGGGVEHVPRKHPARQSLEASQAVARLNRLRDGLPLFWQQNPAGIDLGAFHSDVLAVGHGAFLMLHERAFVNSTALLKELQTRLGDEFRWHLAREQTLPTLSAVRYYPFNSQLVAVGDGLQIIAPSDCQQSPEATSYLESVVAADNPVVGVEYLDVRQSMANGGGPACLRLRVTLTAEERSAITANVILNAELERQLEDWVGRNYREQLTEGELADPLLLDETQRALDELTQLTGVGSVYSFQTDSS